MENTAIQIIKDFQEAGFEAYFAGGSVRDLLMGHEPKDYDIATSATPDEIEHVLQDHKIIPIGKDFGVMLAVVEGHHFEIATFRSDSGYSDGRRPDAVTFTSAKEDAVRRDFTINGLFYDPIKKDVIDFVDGQQDIKDGVIRFIGEPHERIKEDHLRLLRAVRFENQFDFKYADSTKKALTDLAHLVKDISAERIGDELNKMMLNPRRASAIQELDQFGILETILPEVTDCKGVEQPKEYHKEGDVFTHLLKSLHDMPEEWVSKRLVWAVLLHDIGKPATLKKAEERIRFDGHAEHGAKLADKLLKRLRFPKADIAEITWLIDNHMSIGQIQDMRRAHQVNFFEHPWFEDLMRVHWCDEHGSVPHDLTMYEEIMVLYEEYKNEPLLPEAFEPLLDGNEIMDLLGLAPGPKIKELTEALRNAQIEGDVKTAEQAKSFLQKMVS